MGQTGRMKDGTLLSEEAMWLEQGDRKFKLEDYQGAIADYTRAIELNPDDAAAYFSRGLAYLGFGRKDQAREGFMKAMELGYRVPPEALNLCR